MEIGNHPPPARLALRVGVSGHRKIAPETIARIASDLDLVFTAIDRFVDEIGARYASYFGAKPALKRLISPLAEGADTLAAETAAQHGYQVQAPLPFPADVYAQDFEGARRDSLENHLRSADAVFELNGSRGEERSEEAAYLAAGYLTLRQCDLLVAIWDGQAARGIGGTAMIVEAAVQRGVPVVWVHAEGAAPPCLLRDDLLYGAPLDQLRGLLWQAHAPPFEVSGKDGDSFDARNKRAVDAFYAEKERRQNFGIAFQLFQSLITLTAPARLTSHHESYAQTTDDDWKPFIASISTQNTKAWKRISAVLASRFSWADGLATYYAEIYRSSYVLNYLLAAFAVLFGLLGLIIGGKIYWVGLELISILFILGITNTGRRRRWHERWIDYRQLAEQLRHLRFLYLTGGSSPSMTPRHGYDGDRAEGTWVQWYYQATLRELGLAPAKATPEHVDLIKRLFLEEEITGQIAYHKRNARRMHRFEHALHRLGDALFATTLAVCACYMALALVGEIGGVEWIHALMLDFKLRVTFVSALLPAFGAAMSGIRVQGEFASTAERSEAMAARLDQLRSEIEADAKGGATDLARLRSFIETTSETMLIENVDWRFVFRGKPLSLPA